MLFDYSEAAEGRFLIEGRNIVARLLHYLDDAVEIHRVASVGECRVEVGIEGTGCGVCVACDAGNLYETADGVSCKADMMLETHFSGILNLSHCASEKLRGSGGSHGTGHTHFALTAHFGA